MAPRFACKSVHMHFTIRWRHKIIFPVFQGDVAHVCHGSLLPSSFCSLCVAGHVCDLENMCSSWYCGGYFYHLVFLLVRFSTSVLHFVFCVVLEDSGTRAIYLTLASAEFSPDRNKYFPRDGLCATLCRHFFLDLPFSTYLIIMVTEVVWIVPMLHYVHPKYDLYEDLFIQ